MLDLFFEPPSNKCNYVSEVDMYNVYIYCNNEEMRGSHLLWFGLFKCGSSSWILPSYGNTLYLNIFLLVFCEPFWDIATWERFQALCCKRPRYLSAVWAFNLLFRLHIIPFYPVCFGCNVFIKRKFWWP